MKFLKNYAVVFALVLGTLSSVLSAQAANPVEKLRAACRGIEKEKDALAVEQAIVVFSEVPQLKAYFENSYGVAVFPTIGKGGLGIGASHGAGWVFREGELVGISKVTQLSVGFQWGGQAFRQIIFFEDETAFRHFTSGNYEFGAQASAVAVTVGVNAQVSTSGGSNAGIGKAQAKTDYTDGVAVFTMEKGGVMYEAAIAGQKFSFQPLNR